MLSHPLFLLFVFALACATGILLRIGLRGRRIDNHPICAACGFDLTGLYYDSRCPECGAGTALWGTRLRGHRKLIERPLWIAAIIGPIALGGSVLALLDILDPQRVQRHKPVAMLTLEAFGGDMVVRDAATNEISARAAFGKLGPMDVAPIIQRILVMQADLEQPWDPYWGNFLEQLRGAGLVSETQWRLYAQQAVVFELEPVGVHPFAPLFKIDLRPRLAVQSRLRLQARAWISLDDIEFGCWATGSATATGSSERRVLRFMINWETGPWNQLSPGLKHARLRTLLDVSEPQPNGQMKILARVEPTDETPVALEDSMLKSLVESFRPNRQKTPVQVIDFGDDAATTRPATRPASRPG